MNLFVEKLWLKNGYGKESNSVNFGAHFTRDRK